MPAEIVYDPNLELVTVCGIQVPTGRKPVSAAEIMDSLRAELAKPYDGANPLKMGLSKGEAMYKDVTDRAADGDLEAIKFLSDRIMGKAVQQVQNLNVNTTLVDFLAQLKQAREERENGS